MCFFFKQKTAYEMRISDWSSDVCSSDLLRRDVLAAGIGVAFVQALPGAQQGAGAVDVDGTAFQCKINGLAITVREDSQPVQALDDAVALRRLELAAPGGEAEVQELEVACGDHRDRAAVAQTGKIGRAHV